ncbi:MAG: DNA repair protein RadA, partial [Acidimicrobiales bacterium]
MARSTTVHRCTACGAVSQRWLGRCPECGAWGALEPEEVARDAHLGPSGQPAAAPVQLAAVDRHLAEPIPTGIGEFDRVLAGGLVPGSVTLVFGEPGVGKSTLLLQVLTAVAGTGRAVLLVSAEESAPQVRARAERLGPMPDTLFVLATPDLAEAEAAVRSLGPALVVVDSVQTVADGAVGSPPGALAQVRACVDGFARAARANGAAVVLVGHVTKEGELAGPRALEHLVDTVVAFEGDRHHSLRVLRAVKHRFGPAGEVGLFEMGDRGLVDVADPGPLLLGDRRPEVPGSAVTALVEGRRSLVVEVQALACAPMGGPPRRTALGLDARRLATVVAVLDARAGIAMGGVEVFASVAGGVKATEPAVDLPLALAVASAVAGVPLPDDLLSFGEIGLAGEVRQVVAAGRRLAEAARLGFARALVPRSAPEGPASLEVVRVSTVTEAIRAALRPARAVPAPRPLPVCAA